LNDFQMQKTARLKVEYTFLLEQNRSMYEMITMCDSIHFQDSIAITEKNMQITWQGNQLINRQKKYEYMEQQFSSAQEQIKDERKRKRLFIGTTAAAMVLLIMTFFD